MISVRTSAAAPFRVSEGLDSKVKSNGMNLQREESRFLSRQTLRCITRLSRAVPFQTFREQWSTEQQEHIKAFNETLIKHDSRRRHVTIYHSICLEFSVVWEQH